MIRVVMKDGRTFEGELFDRHYDAYKREGWFDLAIDHIRHPDVPAIFLFEECTRVFDLAQPDIDLLSRWQGLEEEAPPLPSTTCPSCHTRHSVIFTYEKESFAYGSAPRTVALVALIDKGRCAACGFAFTDWRAEKARASAIQEHLQKLKGP